MLGNIGPWQLVILLAIVLLVFGSKKIRNLGGDLGAALRGFKKGLNEDDDPKLEADPPTENGAGDVHRESTSEKS